jgi:hypothetical protein
MKHNEVSVVPSSASSVVNNACKLLENTAYIPDDTLTTRLNILKDQVTIYEQRAKFELTEREQKMDGQMRVYVTEHNLREEKLKNELSSLQKQLDLTVKQKQEIQESVKTLKQDFKEKETKLLNDFSRLKTLKNKLENKLYTQDHTIQTAQMMHKHKKLCDEHSETNVGEPKSNFLRSVKAAQPALYDGNELFKGYHAPPNVRSTDEGNLIEDENRKKLDEKMNDPKCLAHRVIVKPFDYYKENMLKVFAPQTKLTQSKFFGH